MDKKRIALIGLFLLMTGLMGYAIYRVFFAPSAPTTPNQNPPSTQGDSNQFPQAATGTITGTVRPGTTLPQAGGSRPQQGTSNTDRTTQGQPGSITRVSGDSIIAPTMTKGGQMNYYDTGSGKFYRVDENGSVRALSDEVFYNVQNVSWSPTTNESIIEYPDGSNIYYNFDTKKQVTLPKHWQDFSFSPQGNAIAAKSVGYSPENRFLVTSDPDGSNVTAVAALGENGNYVTVDWSPNQQIIALSRTGEALGSDRQQVLFIGKNKENFPATVVEGRDLRTEWSPTGNKLLYSVYNAQNDFKPQLWIVNTSLDNLGGNRKLLNVETWSDKCSFENERFVLCGVPQSLDTGAGLAPEIANNIPDILYRIDTTTGIKTEIPMTEPHVIDDIFVNEADNAIYFTDKNQSGLFRVSL